MDSISQKTENTKRYLPHDLKTKENAVKTYADLKEEYTSLKALLGTAGVNLTELVKIKE